ncbi:hypothetical protein BH09PSE2_BH09PSE2_01740 [soil metagenome]
MSAATLTKLGLLAVALFGAGSLAACGTQGRLVRPEPLYGRSAARQYQEDVAAGRRSGDPAVDASASKRMPGAKDAASTDVDNTPKTTRDLRDPAQDLTPLSSRPVDGLPNPLGAPVSVRPPG